jgi:cell division septation protein DedD
MSKVLDLQSDCSRDRVLRYVTVAGLCVGVLSGCAMWPKALTWGSDNAEPEAPATVATPAPASPVIAPPVVAESPKAPLPAPIPSNVADTVPLEPQPVLKAAPQAALPAETSSMKAPMKGMANAKAHKSASGEMVRGYYINVGLFAVVSNGTKAFQALEKADFPVFTDIVKGKGRSLTRVRVGPYLTKAQAETAAEKIKGMNLDAVVFQH